MRMHRIYKMTPSFTNSDLDNAYIEGFNNALKLCDANTEDLLDWTETLLCNSLPAPPCTREKWDKLIKRWRDQKHGLTPDEEPTCEHPMK